MSKAEQIVEALLEDGCIAVDLDGTLAKDSGWKGKEHIGPPVEKMMDRVKKWLKSGKTVKIFTARASDPKTVPHVKAWLKKQAEKEGLPELADLEVTNEKTPDIEYFYDDRAKRVIKNKGILAR